MSDLRARCATTADWNMSAKRRGCFFYGCLIVLILALVGGLSIFFGVRYAINSFVNNYTDSRPTPLPKARISKDELAKLQKRIADFQAGLAAKKVTAPLDLSAAELNALISNDPAWSELKDKLFVEIVTNRIKGKVSIPLEGLGISRLRGRYLNGAATLNLSLTNGTLSVFLDAVEVKGKPIPARFMGDLKRMNFAEGVNRQPGHVKTLQALESLEVNDGQILIKAKSRN